VAAPQSGAATKSKDPYPLNSLIVREAFSQPIGCPAEQSEAEAQQGGAGLKGLRQKPE